MAGACLEWVPGYLEVLDRHGVRWERVVSRRPGRIVYEDGQQVVAVPVTATAGCRTAERAARAEPADRVR